MKKALFVGINKYPGSPLRGCVNDVLLMYKILNEKLAFGKADMKVITDAEATKKNILANLDWLVKGSKAGDTLYFHYSGHGSQVAVTDRTNTDEVDGQDEIICNIDLDWNDPIRDNDLGAIVKKAPKGVKIVFVLDSCHSGTGLRNSWDPNGQVLNRFLPPPPSNLLSNPQINLDDDLNFVLPELSKGILSSKKPFMIDTVNQGDALLLSGCQDNQTSADAYIGGRYQGAFTCTLAQVLAQGGYKLSYGDLIDKVNQELDKTGYDQNPQLEGHQAYFSLPFLG